MSTPNSGNFPIIKIEDTDFKEKKNWTYPLETKSKTNDFPTQDILCPSPETNLKKKIRYTFVVIDYR